MTNQQVEILLVEDNPDDVELTLHALRKENLAAFHATGPCTSTSSRSARKPWSFSSVTANLPGAPSIGRPSWCCST